MSGMDVRSLLVSTVAVVVIASLNPSSASACSALSQSCTLSIQSVQPQNTAVGMPLNVELRVQSDTPTISPVGPDAGGPVTSGNGAVDSGADDGGCTLVSGRSETAAGTVWFALAALLVRRRYRQVARRA